MTNTPTSIPTFSTAAAAWFEDHKRYIKPNTADSYGDALGPLNRFFGDKPINEIEITARFRPSGRPGERRRLDRCWNTESRSAGAVPTCD